MKAMSSSSELTAPTVSCREGDSLMSTGSSIAARPRQLAQRKERDHEEDHGEGGAAGEELAGPRSSPFGAS